LKDGSTVRLNTDTSLETSFSARQRRLTLHRGEAYFEVAHDPDRPFIVDAGNLEVRALGTAFNVYLEGETGVVTVTKGVVRVSERNVPGTRPPQSELLYPDQQLSGDRRGLGTASPVEADHRLAWRDGRLVAEAMPLAALVKELSRYHPNRIFIAEHQLAERTVSGVFMLEDLDSILLALEHTAQVRSVTLEDGSVQLIGAPL
jgi:transmembrane sensor